MSEHIVPRSTYYVIFGLLMFCTYLTVQVAYFDLGAFNAVAALAIAVFKATLVVLFFMHVRYSSHLVQFFAGATFFWLAILFVMTLSDYFSREWPAVAPVEPAAVVGTSSPPTAHQ